MDVAENAATMTGFVVLSIAVLSGGGRRLKCLPFSVIVDCLKSMTAYCSDMKSIPIIMLCVVWSA